MRSNDQLSLRVPQLLPLEQDSLLVENTTYSHQLDRFRHVKKLMTMFSQKLMTFLDKTHESSLTDWMSKDAQGVWSVGALKKTEGAYPPHVIAFRDLINFLSAISENLELLNQLLTSSRKGIVDMAVLTYWRFLTNPLHATLSETHKNYKNIQTLFESLEKLQKSIGAIKKLPIHNGIIDGSLYLYDQLSKYFQGDASGAHLMTVMQVMKDALVSSELLQLKQNEEEIEKLLKGKLFVKAALELDYWKILLATSESQRKTALDHARKLTIKTNAERAVLDKIEKFVASPAWCVQSDAFLEDVQALPVDQEIKNHHLKPEKLWLYVMQLKSIISQIIAVSPEFMAEDNDVGSMLRMMGTLTRLPTDMIKNIDQKWFVHVVAWLCDNYHELCKDPQLKIIVESIYNIHTNFLSDLDELETQLGLKFGLLTHDLPKKLGALKPQWLALSDVEQPGPTEQRLRAQGVVWERYLQKQTYFRARQRITRWAYQTDLLEKKKVMMRGLLEAPRLQKISHIYTLNASEAEALVNELIDIAEEIPALSSLRKYIEKKLQELRTHIAGENYRLGRILTVRNRLLTQAGGYFISSNVNANEKHLIELAIIATEKEFEASLAREDEHLKTVWEAYQETIDQPDLNEIIKKLKEAEELTVQIKALEERVYAHPLEDERAWRASEIDQKNLAVLVEKMEQNTLDLDRLYACSRQLEEEKEKALVRLAKNIEKNHQSIVNTDRKLVASRAITSKVLQIKKVKDCVAGGLGADAAQTNLAERSAQDAVEEQGSIEQFLKQLDSLIGSLATHIADGQRYQEQVLSPEHPLFSIRQCDAQWIRQLKHAHNLLVQAKKLVSEYLDNVKVQEKPHTLTFKAYLSIAVPFSLFDHALKLFSQLGDILEGINALEPHMGEAWFKPLQELFSAMQAFSLTADEIALAPREAEIPVNVDMPEISVSVSQIIRQDVQELLVELPSNLPSRAELDRHLTDLFSMLNRLLGADNVSLSGLALYNSIAFSQLMDLISKITAIAGSDFVYEKLANYRALLTEKLSAAIQCVLSEEITLGYRAGVITAAVYQKAEVLASYGLIDISTLYTAQLAYLHEKNLEADVKAHFAAHIESLLMAYALKQKEEWSGAQVALTEELHTINEAVYKIKSTVLAGKDLMTQQQSLEFRGAQINRLIVAKNRAVIFLEQYARARQEERAALRAKHAKQEKMLATLSRIVRLLTMVKWDIYYYERSVFDKKIVKINQLIGFLEAHIQQLAKNEVVDFKSSPANAITDERLQTLPPAMQHLFMLARQAIETDLAISTSDARNDNVLLRQATLFAVRRNVHRPIAPVEGLYQALMDYAHEEAKRLNVKDEWYRRNIIEHLEIFAEMWSPEKARDSKVVKRREQILAALQAENAPDYKLLSHPADVKIVYLLTVSGEYGLDFHSRIFSRVGMQRANAQFTPDAVPVAASLPSRKKYHEAVSAAEIESAIIAYQRSCPRCAFFNGESRFLTEQNITYLNETAKKYAGEKNPKATEKLRAIYNALIAQDPNALAEAVFLETGILKGSTAGGYEFKNPQSHK